MISRESYVADNPPLPTQLFDIAKLALGVARDTNRLRKPDGVSAVYSISDLFWINEMSGLLYGSESTMGARHIVSMRLGRKATDIRFIKDWSLKLLDTEWYEKPNNDWQGVRSTYRFEWGQDGVTVAEKKTTVVPSRDYGDLYNDLVNFRAPEPALWAAGNEMREVTRGDCDIILEKISDYYDQIRKTAA